MSRDRSSSESEDEEMVYAPSAAKRIKLSHRSNGHVTDTEAETNGSSSNPTTVDGEEEVESLKFDDDGYVEGSIIKITLTNFVTYDYCEIFPGPQMNMIIGPNGTGKSTIVCAIALGLGGQPALLGRAKQIQEFVKTGEDEATISIELKKVGVRNIIIQRSFKTSSNTNMWRLNGKTSSQREVMQIIRDLNIQVDNLCQFLPQDRVSEFAELSPSQLLERTQAATGATELHEMQQKLVEWRDKEKEYQKAVESDLDHLKNLNDKNKDLERDVFRMQQREEVQKRIYLLEAQIPLIKYSEAKANTEAIKQKFNEKKLVVENVKAELAPIQQVNKNSDTEAKRISKKQLDETHRVKNALQAVKKAADDIKSTREKIKSDTATIQSIKVKLPEREREIKQCEMQIEKYEELSANPPSGDTSEFEKIILEVNNEANDLNTNYDEYKNKNNDIHQKKNEMHGILKSKQREVEDIQNVAAQRKKMVASRYPHVLKAYEYVRANREKFQRRVHGPLALEINVKDARYTNMLEQLLGGARGSHLRTFICETQEDYKTFTRILVDEQKLRLDVTWAGDGNNLNELRAACSAAELQSKFEMEYFAIDLVDANPHVLAYLRREVNLHVIPLSLKSSQEQRVVNSGAFQKFCIGNTFYNVKRSDYGRKAKQTSTTPIRNAEMIGNAIDTDARNALIEEMKLIHGNIQQADVMMKEYSSEMDKLKIKSQELKHKKEDAQIQKREVQMKLQMHRKYLAKLEQSKAELVQLKKSPELLLQQIQKLEKSVEALRSCEVEHIRNYVEAMKTFVDYYETRNVYKLQYIHAAAKLEAIRIYSKEQMRTLQEAEKYLATAKNQLTLAQRTAQQCLNQCKDAGNRLPEVLHDQFQAIMVTWKESGLTGTTEELFEKIAEEKGKMEAIRFANPNAMAHYEERKAEIAKLESDIHKKKVEAEKCKIEITKLKAEWEPRIERMVSRISTKFSEAFARINCVGEVAVDKHDDFDKWGINILVKFRENEKLQLLTGQRQSGGERSVSTVLYLMSLQNLAKSPFRVVDEINQGMDPRNERMIHEQIVQGASRPGTSQYFLITPKLLPDLFYNERMRVLCIYNSEWLPSKINPLSHYLEHAQTNNIA